MGLADSLVPRRGRPPPGRQRISKSRQGVSGSFEGSGQGAKDPGLGSSWYSGPDDGVLSHQALMPPWALLSKPKRAYMHTDLFCAIPLAGSRSFAITLAE